MAQQIHTREQEFIILMKSKKNKSESDEKEPTKLTEIITPKLLQLIILAVAKNPKDTQIEFVHYLMELTNIVLVNKELRNVLLDA
jgi:hypothetical protein